MSKKRKTLVDNFAEIIANGNIEEFKKVFDKCEINACVRGASKCNALSFTKLTPQHIQFLIDKGININDNCGFNQSAVAHHSNNMENLKCLIKNGADIDLAIGALNRNALFYAAIQHNALAISNLLECGANPNVIDSLNGYNVLEETLLTCNNIDIINTLEISKLLLNSGVKRTDKMKTFVQNIGKRFEFSRAQFNKDFVEEYSNALMELYKLFDIKPVQKRKMYIYNPKTPITVKSNTWIKQHNELWEMLVPSSGHAETVQGELIRITGKISREILDNGGINWNSEYKKLPLAIPDYLKMANGADSKLVDEACSIAKKISANTDSATLYRLSELIVNWVIANPMPISLTKVDYNR